MTPGKNKPTETETETESVVCMNCIGTSGRQAGRYLRCMQLACLGSDENRLPIPSLYIRGGKGFIEEEEHFGFWVRN